MLQELAARVCEPCHSGTARLSEDEAQALLASLGPSWVVQDQHHLFKEYRFATFAAALAFANRVGELADALDHHPELELGWGYCRVRIWTHSVSGLSEADFVLAARCELL